MRRQDAPPVYGVSGSVFAYRRSSLETIEHLYAGAWGGYLVPRERAIEVDNEVDLRFVRDHDVSDRHRGTGVTATRHWHGRRVLVTGQTVSSGAT